MHVESKRLPICAVIARLDTAKDLERLPLDLLLFATDVRHDVIKDVQGCHARVPCARDGLHGGDKDGLDGAERLFERGKGDDDGGGRAVGVGDDEALGEGLQAALLGDDGEMGGVDEGDDEGDVGISSEVLGVGEDRELCGAEGGLCGCVSGEGIDGARRSRTDIARNVRVEPGEDDGAVGEVLRLAGVDDDVRGHGGDGDGLLPGDGARVRLARRAGGRA